MGMFKIVLATICSQLSLEYAYCAEANILIIWHLSRYRRL
uniref:Uncharacterized protein n=1 Tax=Arundo donax TaxID=35708 RepID=A0A0A9EC68_ARUDO